MNLSLTKKRVCIFCQDCQNNLICIVIPGIPSYSYISASHLVSRYFQGFSWIISALYYRISVHIFLNKSLMVSTFFTNNFYFVYDYQTTESNVTKDFLSEAVKFLIAPNNSTLQIQSSIEVKSLTTEVKLALSLKCIVNNNSLFFCSNNHLNKDIKRQSVPVTIGIFPLGLCDLRGIFLRASRYFLLASRFGGGYKMEKPFTIKTTS